MRKEIAEIEVEGDVKYEEEEEGGGGGDGEGRDDEEVVENKRCRQMLLIRYSESVYHFLGKTQNLIKNISFVMENAQF